MTIRNKLYKIIFETDTRAGRIFDIVLLWLIVFSVLAVIFESIPEYDKDYHFFFSRLEWLFTLIFSLEYLIRIIVSNKPKNYIGSFWGIIDLLAVLPTYLSFIFVGYHYLLIVRILRLLRVFRILKLSRFTSESLILYNAIKSSFYKIVVFFVTVIMLVVIMGTLMYVVEGATNGFNSIPQCIYWAIVTVTTVGYGDIVPLTIAGKIISSLAMIIGYAIIAVPTGIVTIELNKTERKRTSNPCPQCNESNLKHANYCAKCGNKLKTNTEYN